MGKKIMIDIDRLVVDVANPRFEEVSTESDAFFSILEDQSRTSGNKILNLARDIATNGLNASELLVVSPIEETDEFRVREGNRRITAIKLSLHSNLVPEHFGSMAAQFGELHDAMQKYRVVECYVTDNEDEINRILSLRHGGEKDGVGTVKWDAVQKARFSQKGNPQSARALSLVNNLQERYGYGDLLATASKIPATNLGRLISTPDVRKALNIKTDGDEVFYLGGCDELLLAVLTKVKCEGVGPIYSKSDRIKLIAETSELIGFDNSKQAQLPLDGSCKNDKADESVVNKIPDSTPSHSTESSVSMPDSSQSDEHDGLEITRRKPVSKDDNMLFGHVLRPKGSKSNDVYRAIDWIDQQYLRNPDGLHHLLPILGFSLRLLMETTAREYYESIGEEHGDDSFNLFMKGVAKPAIKNKLNAVERNDMALASEWIDDKFRFEALLHKWAHGTMATERASIVRQSKLVALIIDEVWT